MKSRPRPPLPRPSTIAKSITALRQELLQAAAIPPAVFHDLRVRSAIGIHQDRVALLRVKIRGAQQGHIQLHAIAGFEMGKLPLPQLLSVQTGHRIGMHNRQRLPGCLIESHMGGRRTIGVGVQVVLCIRGEQAAMRAGRVGELDDIAAAIQQNAEQVGLHRCRALRGKVKHPMRRVHAYDLRHFPFPTGKLTKQLPGTVVKVRMFCNPSRSESQRKTHW